MFTWLNKQGVRSDCGFEVQRTGRFSAEYREGSRVIEVSVESGGGMPSIIIGPDSFARWKSGILIPREEQERIIKNFREAMEFQGLKLLIE
jgi:hypothetical protein